MNELLLPDPVVLFRYTFFILPSLPPASLRYNWQIIFILQLLKTLKQVSHFPSFSYLLIISISTFYLIYSTEMISSKENLMMFFSLKLASNVSFKLLTFLSLPHFTPPLSTVSSITPQEALSTTTPQCLRSCYVPDRDIGFCHSNFLYYD